MISTPDTEVMPASEELMQKIFGGPSSMTQVISTPDSQSRPLPASEPSEELMQKIFGGPSSMTQVISTPDSPSRTLGHSSEAIPASGVNLCQSDLVRRVFGEPMV